MMIKSPLIVLLITSLANYGSSAKISCEAELKNADKCLGEVIVVGAEDIPMFRTVQDLEKMYCDNLKPRIKCSKGYSKCLKAFPRTIYSVALNGLKKIGSICRTEEMKKEFVDYFSCFPPKNSTEFLTRIGNRVTLAMNHVLTVDANDMIPTLCCSYHTVMRQVGESVDDYCEVKNGAKEETGKYFVNLINLALNDPVELVCGAYANYDVCMNKIPNQMISISNATRWELTKEFISTPIVPVLKVVEQLDKDMNI